ncbi:50S ribosomal protein L14 [Candidatus Carsonella ruddii]|uniref:Large ribosomal subunit protein uL14 n=2 Tax=Carsonella ruddii TaxID=114186 RepID=A0AAE7G5Z7_CARRU|nr:50S ribosomal protein L14 [Candidatus Carsonella ruddii]AGS06663.1 50S ribosomal protein L14 [Candidatus Carsonella ruddii DC]ALA96926.1 50S ribosomal protein L14 [Candidatus Carsonella ruddii]QLK14136.1 50S ribosomal protein L14 [Candidatus Carsonella ruddii]
MIREQTLVKVIDNSGAKIAKCVKILNGSKKKTAKIGDFIKVVIKNSNVNSKIKKGQIMNAILVRSKYPFRRKDGTLLSFNDNAVILLNNSKKLIGTRVFGVLAKEIKLNHFNKLFSLSNELV